MASWLDKYFGLDDINSARSLAEANSRDQLVDMSASIERRNSRYSRYYIPAAAFFSFIVALSLPTTDFWPSREFGGFVAIFSMLVPVAVVLRGLKIQQFGRMLTLATYIREYKDETAENTDENTGDG